MKYLYYTIRTLILPLWIVFMLFSCATWQDFKEGITYFYLQ